MTVGYQDKPGTMACVNELTGLDPADTWRVGDLRRVEEGCMTAKTAYISDPLNQT